MAEGGRLLIVGAGSCTASSNLALRVHNHISPEMVTNDRE